VNILLAGAGRRLIGPPCGGPTNQRPGGGGGGPTGVLPADGFVGSVQRLTFRTSARDKTMLLCRSMVFFALQPRRLAGRYVRIGCGARADRGGVQRFPMLERRC